MTNRKFFFDRSLTLVVAISILMTASVIAALGQTQNVLYNFTGGADGAEPAVVCRRRSRFPRRVGSDARRPPPVGLDTPRFGC